MSTHIEPTDARPTDRYVQMASDPDLFNRWEAGQDLARALIVARAKGAPVTLETILVPDPGPGEAVVAVQACGVCHTDLHYRDGGINDEFPFLLGHEAAGVVEAVGDGVTNVKPGDFVVLNWRAVCGDCRAGRRRRHCPAHR